MVRIQPNKAEIEEDAILRALRARLAAGVAARHKLLEAVRLAAPEDAFPCDICGELRSADGLRRNKIASPRLVCPVCISSARAHCEVCLLTVHLNSCARCYQCKRRTCFECQRYEIPKRRKKTVAAFCFACRPQRRDVDFYRDFLPPNKSLDAPKIVS